MEVETGTPPIMIEAVKEGNGEHADGTDGKMIPPATPVVKAEGEEEEEGKEREGGEDAAEPQEISEISDKAAATSADSTLPTAMVDDVRTALPAAEPDSRTDGEPVPTDGEPILTDGAPIPTDRRPVPMDGEPVPTDREPILTDGAPVPTEGAVVTAGSGGNKRSAAGVTLVARLGAGGSNSGGALEAEVEAEGGATVAAATAAADSRDARVTREENGGEKDAVVSKKRPLPTEDTAERGVISGETCGGSGGGGQGEEEHPAKR